jgi:formylglycine-generating enzyme required for sulfatase activity
MDELEVSLQQNKNFATVEAFGPAHAKQVLAAFGRAYGAVADPITPTQLAFIEDAIDGLQSQGLINPVQLALLSEMTKGKTWSSATLRELGGIRGMGIAFLDEKLVGGSAHPVLRTHPESVRLLLAELLPPDNTVIKPPAIQESQLVQILQYAIPAETVRKILHLLDTELRLITPTSGVPTGRNSSTGSSVGDPAYQLAHDYLVPTTREWLALHQSETRAGRVREQLRELANAWNAKPSNKRLPTSWEWLSIRWFTSAAHWTEPERQMMRRSDRRVARNTLGFFLGASLILLVALWALGSNYTASLAQRLRQADSSQVVEVLKELDRFRSSSLRFFASEPGWMPTAEDEASDRAKLQLALAGIEESPEQAEYVRDHLHEFESRHLGPILLYLSQKSIGDERTLVESVQDAIAHGQPQALTLSALLAQRAPQNAVWGEIASSIDTLLLSKPATEFGYWSELFMPVAGQLVPGLLEKGKEYRRDNDPMADTCRLMIQRFASKDPVALADAMTWSGVEGVKSLVGNVTSKESQDKLSLEIRNRIQQLTRPPYPALSSAVSGGKDSDKDASLSRDSNAQKANALCDAYGGIAHGRGGWMDRVPLSAVASLIDPMRELGFKPWSIRPKAVRSTSGELTQWATITWGRSDETFETLLDVTRDELKQEFDKRKQQGWVMVDFASLPQIDDPSQSAIAPADSERIRERRWWGIWRKTSDGSIEDQSLALDSVSNNPKERGDRVPQRTQYLPTSSGGFLFDGLFTSITKPMRDSLEDRASDCDYQTRIGVAAGDLYPGVPCSDIRVHEFGSVRDRARLPSDLSFFNQPGQNETPSSAANRLVHLSEVLLDLGDAESALEVLEEIDIESLKSFGASADQRIQNTWKRAKGMALAKLSRTEELRRWIADEIEPSDLEDYEKRLLQLRLALLDQNREQTAGALSEMESVTAKNSDSVAAMNKGREAMLRGWALVASQPWGREVLPGLMERFCSRAQQWSANHPDLFACTFSADFDGLQADATWKSWCFKNRLTARVSSTCWMRRGVDTEVDYGVRESDFRRGAMVRLEQGFMPTAMESISDGDGNKLTWCLWEKPEVPLMDRAYRAREIANLSLGLVFLGQPDQMHYGLQDRWGRSVRTALIDGAARVLEPRMLVQWFNESAPSMQVAYLEILGGIPWSAMDPLSQRILQESAIKLAEDAVDVRLANTARWCCTMWQLPIPEFPINQKPDPSRNWFTNRLGQQFAVIDIPERVVCGKGKNRVWKQVDRRIAIATTETTGSVFEEFLNDSKTRAWINADTGKRFVRAERPEDPQGKVSWNLAVRFCQWLNEQEDVPEDQWCYLNVWEASSNAFRFAPNYVERTGYRLPTYAEWKQVCSGGTDEAWHFGSDASMVSLYEWTMPHSGNRRQGIARKRPNALGVFDIGGSLAEWCDDLAPSMRRDRWRPFILDDGNPAIVVGREDNFTSAGGRFKFTADSAITDSFVFNGPDQPTVSTGFRVARTLKEGINRSVTQSP